MVALSRELYKHHRPSRQQTMTQHWCDEKRSCHIHFDYPHGIPLKSCTVYFVNRPRTSPPRYALQNSTNNSPPRRTPARVVLPRPSRGSSTRTRACRPAAGPCSALRSGGGPRRTSRGLYPGAAPVDQNTGTTAVSIQMKSLLYGPQQRFSWYQNRSEQQRSQCSLLKAQHVHSSHCLNVTDWAA
jgi:hypothetical protein